MRDGAARMMHKVCSKTKWTKYRAIVANSVQKGKCALCGGPNPKCRDHDHDFDRPRALLCDGCNTMEGFVKSAVSRSELSVEQFLHGLLKYMTNDHDIVQEIDEGEQQFLGLCVSPVSTERDDNA